MNAMTPTPGTELLSRAAEAANRLMTQAQNLMEVANAQAVALGANLQPPTLPSAPMPMKTPLALAQDYAAYITDTVQRSVLYWDVMRRACERGFRTFDYGRSKHGTGSFAFKKHWGFVPQPLYYEFKLLRGDTIPEVNPLNPKYRTFIAAWKRLPLPVANRIGPFLARQLG